MTPNVYDTAEAADNCVQDAIMYGMGVMIMRMDQKLGLVFQHVPRDKYTEFIEALQWQRDENKGAIQ